MDLTPHRTSLANTTPRHLVLSCHRFTTAKPCSLSSVSAAFSRAAASLNSDGSGLPKAQRM